MNLQIIKYLNNRQIIKIINMIKFLHKIQEKPKMNFFQIKKGERIKWNQRINVLNINFCYYNLENQFNCNINDCEYLKN